MLVWIIVGVVAVALAVFAFWPRRRGISDRAVGDSRSRTQGKVENFDNPMIGGHF